MTNLFMHSEDKNNLQEWLDIFFRKEKYEVAKERFIFGVKTEKLNFEVECLQRYNKKKLNGQTEIMYFNEEDNDIKILSKFIIARAKKLKCDVVITNKCSPELKALLKDVLVRPKLPAKGKFLNPMKVLAAK